MTNAEKTRKTACLGVWADPRVSCEYLCDDPAVTVGEMKSIMEALVITAVNNNVDVRLTNNDVSSTSYPDVDMKANLLTLEQFTTVVQPCDAVKERMKAAARSHDANQNSDTLKEIKEIRKLLDAETQARKDIERKQEETSRKLEEAEQKRKEAEQKRKEDEKKNREEDEKNRKEDEKNREEDEKNRKETLRKLEETSRKLEEVEQKRKEEEKNREEDEKNRKETLRKLEETSRKLEEVEQKRKEEEKKRKEEEMKEKKRQKQSEEGLKLKLEKLGGQVKKLRDQLAPIFLRILLDHGRKEVVSCFEEAKTWEDLVEKFGGRNGDRVVRPELVEAIMTKLQGNKRINYHLSREGIQFLYQLNEFRKAGNEHAHNAAPDDIKSAIDMHNPHHPNTHLLKELYQFVYQTKY